MLTPQNTWQDVLKEREIYDVGLIHKVLKIIDREVNMLYTQTQLKNWDEVTRLSKNLLNLTDRIKHNIESKNLTNWERSLGDKE